MNARQLLTVPIALTAVVGIAGCQKTLDTSKAEKTIKDELSKNAGVKIKSVDCPSDVKAKKGDVFSCIAKATNGRKVTIKVTQRDGKGNVSYGIAGSR